MVELLEELNSISTWKASNIQHAIEDILSKHEVGFGKVGLPLRIALTGSTNSPSIDKTAEVLGQTVVIERIEKAIKQFS